jgi:heptosyltransferase II
MKLLVISLAGIGDTLFATPLIHELRLNQPTAEIDVLVLWPGARDILEGNPHVNAVHQKNLIRAGQSESFRFLWNLRQRHYDATINTMPQSRVQYRIAARLIGAPLRLSHSYPHLGWLTPLLVNRTTAPDYGKHCVDNNLALLPFLGLAPKLGQHGYELFLTAAEQEWAEAYLARERVPAGRLLGIHVGSGGTKNLALRRWPLASYRDLIRQLNHSHPDVGVLLFGGPEEEKDHAQLLAEVDRAKTFVPPTRNLRQAAALVGRCRLFLSVDTALMHLAAAMNVPAQIVIETPTWNKTVEPYGRPFVLVPNPAVAGRNLEFYRYDGRGIRGSRDAILRSMSAVPVEAVYRAVVEALPTARP